MNLANKKKIKIAIVHDWLTGMRGGEKCLECFCELFPDATVFTLVHVKGSVSPTIEKMDIRTSFLNRIPAIGVHYRKFLPLFTNAIESFDLSGYDIILSSSHCVAKGVRVPQNALHICYCYTPVRYAWMFYDEYFSSYSTVKRKLIKFFLERLKKWDLLSNKSIDYFVAISDNVKNRINEFYSRKADVIYPPVDVVPVKGKKEGKEGEYYLAVSAMVPYKRMDIAIAAFNSNNKRLIVVGSGPEYEILKKKALPNIEFKGWVADKELKEYYAGCKALVFPGEEDFGIVPVEAQVYGKPVIAYAKGGVLETVVPLGAKNPPTGVFFFEQTEEALAKAIGDLEKNESFFSAEKIKDNAARFNKERFKKEIKEYLEKKWGAHISKKGATIRAFGDGVKGEKGNETKK